MADKAPRPSYERRAAARKAPSEILMRDISDPARSRRIPNPVLRAGRSGIPVPVLRHPLPEPTGLVGEDIEIETDADTSSESSRRTGKDDDDHDATIRTTTTVTKRSRDALSSLSPIQESAPKRADQRASIDAETPRSPSPEQYAELTLNSTTYAALAVEAGEGRERYLSPPPSLTPIKTYAAMAASPPRPKSQLQDNERRISPGSSTAVTGTKAGTTITVQSDVAADADAITQGVRGYPPLVVESLPNWVSHFEELRRLLGHTPNAWPFGKGRRVKITTLRGSATRRWPRGQQRPCHRHTESRHGPRLATSQRPITLLSHIAKLFERIALRRLLRHLTPRQEQFGFRCGHSTTLQLARVLHHMAAEHNRGRRTVGVFLDIEKAFDRVWHPGLVFKLLNTQTPPALVRTVASFLEGRSFFVAVEDATSDPRPIHAGVPQGSCLSPCLYGVYTDDIPTLAGQLQDWEEDVVLALYADDSAYFASSRRADLAAAKIQRVLDLLPEWLGKWRVAVNVTKTAEILTGQQRTMPPKLRLRGQDVEWQTKVRYLGVQIDRSMHMAAQVKQVIHQSRAARSMLRPVLRSHLPLRAKLALYKGYIRSRLTYAALAWYALCSTTQRKRIQAQQSIALRMIVGAGRYVLNDVIARDLCIETVEEFIRRIARRMFDIADQGPHEFLRNVAPTHESSPSGRPFPREITKTPPPKQNRRGCFPDEKTPGHEPIISPPTRTYTHRHEGVEAPRTNGRARGTFLVGFGLTLPTRTGARVCGIDILTPSTSQVGNKKEKKTLMRRHSSEFGSEAAEACTREEKQPEVRAYAAIAEIAVTDTYSVVCSYPIQRYGCVGSDCTWCRRAGRARVSGPLRRQWPFPPCHFGSVWGASGRSSAARGAPPPPAAIASYRARGRRIPGALGAVVC
ncbi:RNA-directed DNA polymerase from mobile element jockey [Eumeta japonica]|uniref:RNA-directed DNA polymerase from mobile element jockey n=1 Tax=Eumeta variegata TaxID=151549 RepID=A0A4C1ZHD1_EUMVA|nr:RNA-directed DNA polymerase from mobile element jockey [Eumeta japonica]